RKKRAKTSCYPCRERKVKCDHQQPCETCTKRGHTELCLYEDSKPGSPRFPPPRPASQFHPSTSPHNGSPRALFEPTNPTSTSIDNHEREAPFLGANSIAAFAQNEDYQAPRMDNQARTAVQDSILPMLGLQDGISPYPFLPEEASTTSVANIYAALPNDKVIIQTFQNYKTRAQAMNPLLVDAEQFELDVCMLLKDRASWPETEPADGISPSIKRPSLAWISLLYAVLASGTQYSDKPHDQRKQISQRFVRLSFDALRLTNYLLRPSLTCLQTFIVLGNVLQNDLKPEGAWIILGTTIRLAQSLGLHEGRLGRTTRAPVLPDKEKRLWENTVWQDSILSLCFDRPPAIDSVNNEEYLVLNDMVTDLQYAEAITRLCHGILRGIAISRRRPLNLSSVADNVREIERIRLHATLHLQELKHCHTVQQLCEYHLHDVHTKFVISWLCRPALSIRASNHERPEFRATLAAKCKESLADCLESFLKLYTLSEYASRSWATLHNGLSSALLLGLIGETHSNPRVRQLQGELIDILTPKASDGEIPAAGTTITLSTFHERALKALKVLYN
ncbi:hypothetical protein K490DRAFT_23, partial [Saccharata proteae CBS 121410]